MSEHVKGLLADALHEIAVGVLAYWAISTVGGSKVECAAVGLLAVLLTDVKNSIRRKFELMWLRMDVDECERELDAALSKQVRQ